MKKDKFIKKTKQATLALAMITAISSLPGMALTIDKVHAVEVVQMQQKIEFPDVRIEWQKAPVKWAVEKDVVGGYPDGTFKPDNQMSEAEWVTMLVRYSSTIDYEKIKNNTISGQHWSQHLYNELAKYGLPFKGYNTDTIKNKPITRGDIAIIVAAKNGFNLTLEQAVEYMYENQLSEGMGQVKDFKNYGANLFLTRAQATAFLQRLNTKPVTTFRGIPSQVAADEILGVKNPVYDGTKEVNHDKPHNHITEAIAKKYGYVAAKGTEVAQIRDTDNKILLGYSVDLGSVHFSSNTKYLDMTLEMIQQIQGYSTSEMTQVKEAITKANTKVNNRYPMIKITLRGKTVQIDGSYTGDLSIHIY